jgi:IS5 family transposase
MRRSSISAANIHDSKVLPRVLDPEKRFDFVGADYGDADVWFSDLLEVAGFEKRVAEKGTSCHPLSEEAMQRNKVRQPCGRGWSMS